jgi:hypothetical protein
VVTSLTSEFAGTQEFCACLGLAGLRRADGQCRLCIVPGAFVALLLVQLRFCVCV